jgi:hypothetical protein
MSDNKDYMAKLRERSGSVDSKDPLVGFLYILMRDHLPVGMVEGIMRDHVNVETDDVDNYSNGWLAEYAKDLSKRLK